MQPGRIRTFKRLGRSGYAILPGWHFANLALAVTKCLTGFWGHSFALIADGLESAPSLRSRKSRANCASVVGMPLIAAAVAIIVESIHGIKTPLPLPKPCTLVVLAGVLVAKEILFRHVGHVAAEIGSTAVSGDAWHHRSDAITSGFAFIAISIALLKGWAAADDCAALGAAIVILYNAKKQFRPAFLELKDRAPDSGLESCVREIAPGLTKCNWIG